MDVRGGAAVDPEGVAVRRGAVGVGDADAFDAGGFVFRAEAVAAVAVDDDVVWVAGLRGEGHGVRERRPFLRPGEGVGAGKDGDAAAVMHMGALATNCRYKAGNMIHIILNNGVNESVGGQPSAGYVVNLTEIAAACGYRTPGHAVETKDELQTIIRDFEQGGMPLFIDVHVRQGIRSDMPKLNIDHKAQKEALMKNLNK